MYIVMMNNEIKRVLIVGLKRKLQSMLKSMILATERNWKRYLIALSMKIAVISYL